ncbi:MAG: putative toxin-antitoxin system toxin component, PIN family [Gemmatimonadota bacterium]|nr:putative toxin-antitoxin system toxin component, PIN family [Gemmatimonadota bacterium]
MSIPLMGELQDVVSRAKFDRYVTPVERERFLGLLFRDAHLVKITESIRACSDPKDNKILELAICGLADWIVSGDPHILVLDPFRDIRIVRPADFLGVLGVKT